MFIHFLCPDAGFSTLALLTLWSEEFFVVGECESCAVETLLSIAVLCPRDISVFPGIVPSQGWGWAWGKVTPSQKTPFVILQRSAGV